MFVIVCKPCKWTSNRNVSHLLEWNSIWNVRTCIKCKVYYVNQLSFEAWSDSNVYLLEYHEDCLRIFQVWFPVSQFWEMEFRISIGKSSCENCVIWTIWMLRVVFFRRLMVGVMLLLSTHVCIFSRASGEIDCVCLKNTLLFEDDYIVSMSV